MARSFASGRRSKTSGLIPITNCWVDAHCLCASVISPHPLISRRREKFSMMTPTNSSRMKNAPTIKNTIKKSAQNRLLSRTGCISMPRWSIAAYITSTQLQHRRNIFVSAFVKYLSLNQNAASSYLSVVDISNSNAIPLSTLLKFCGMVWTHSPSRQSHTSLDVGIFLDSQALAPQFAKLVSSHATSVSVISLTSFGYVTRFSCSDVNGDSLHLLNVPFKKVTPNIEHTKKNSAHTTPSYYVQVEYYVSDFFSEHIQKNMVGTYPRRRLMAKTLAMHLPQP